MYKGKFVYTIQAADVGKPISRLPGCDSLSGWGKVAEGDVGKQFWETTPGVIQLENTEQRDKRTATVK